MTPEHEKPTPASVYLVVSPDQKVRYLRQFNSGWLFSFLEQEVALALRRYKNAEIPDHWLLEYRFYDRKDIPPFQATDNSDYLTRLLPATEKLGIWPTHAIRLKDAVFCHLLDINPLGNDTTHDKLLGQEYDCLSYEDNLQRQLLTEKSYEMPCWKALESDRGVLLFSDNEQGQIAYRKYRQYLTDHFFNPKLGITFLNEYRIPTFQTSLKPYVDRFFHLHIRHRQEKLRMTPIPQEIFAPYGVVKAGFCHRTHRMLPTGLDFAAFIETGNLKITMENCRLATLLYLIETNSPLYLQPEHYQINPYKQELEELEKRYYHQPWDERKDAFSTFGSDRLATDIQYPYRGNNAEYGNELVQSMPNTVLPKPKLF